MTMLFFIITFLLPNTDPVLPKTVMTELENNIITYRLVKTADIGVNDFDLIIYNQPVFSKYLLRGDQRLALSVSRYKDYKYPVEGYDLFLVKNPRKSIIIGDSIVSSNFTHDASPCFCDFLIAYNFENQDIKYIGGEFFKTGIMLDFANVAEPVNEMLKLKYFQYNLESIKLKRNSKKFYIYEAFSNAIKAKVTFKIKKPYTDFIEIINIKYKNEDPTH